MCNELTSHNSTGQVSSNIKELSALYSLSKVKLSILKSNNYCSCAHLILCIHARIAVHLNSMCTPLIVYGIIHMLIFSAHSHVPVDVCFLLVVL